MEEQSQLLDQGKAMRDETQESSAGTVCSPLLPVCSPDNGAQQLPSSNSCRECLVAMAHRLSQPMTALRGSIELALIGKRSAVEDQTLLEHVLRLSDNLAQLIVSLRELAESDAPGGTPNSVSLDACVAEVVAEMESFAQSRELRLRCSVMEGVHISANPERLREMFQNLLAWVVQNSAGGGAINIEVSRHETSMQVFISPPRLDLQYLQIKALEDVATPGLIFSHAAKHGALGWAINQRLVHAVGGKLEVLSEGPDAGCIRATFPQPKAAVR